MAEAALVGSPAFAAVPGWCFPPGHGHRPVTGTFDPAAPCIRGHIPSSQNTGLGGQFGRYVQRDRLIQDDPFWVSITK